MPVPPAAGPDLNPSVIDPPVRAPAVTAGPPAAAPVAPRHGFPVDGPRRLPPSAVGSGSPYPAPAGNFPPAWSPPALTAECPPPEPTDPEAWAYLEPYARRAESFPDREPQLSDRGGMVTLPAEFQPWWAPRVGDQTRPGSCLLSVDQENLLLAALVHSPDVRAVRAEVDSRQALVGKEYGRFDWRAFADVNYDFTSDPVGNELTTGGPPRYRDRLWDASAGVRKENGWGGEVEIAQKIGRQYNNSTFFTPTDQGQTRLEISYIHPLLGKAGKAYTESRVVLAQIDADVARCKLCRDLQNHLFRVSQAYWDLYRARVIRLQKQDLRDRAQTILDMLQARTEVDAVQQQVLRAQAGVTSRRSEILRSQAEVRNAESRLRLLVNDPRLIDGGRIEMVPAEWPLPCYVPVSMRESLQTAVRSRPDVAEAMREIRAAGVRLGIAKNELLPKLDLILSTYVAGLEGDAEIGTAVGNQFTVGEPGYSAGLLFEIPLGNHTARGECDRRQSELQRAMLIFRSTVETGLTEVELAVREVDTAYQEMVSKFQALVAADAEEKYLSERWRLIPGDDGKTPNLLEDLLDAQDRLAEEEAAFVTAQVNHTLALTALKRATGTLMRFTGNGCGP